MSKKNVLPTRTEMIRKVYANNPDASPKYVVNSLRDDGIEVSLRLVHGVRSTLRARSAAVAERIRLTRENNEVSLSDHILKVLMREPNGLTDHSILEQVQKAGYKSHSQDFLNVVRQKLYNMSRDGHLYKKIDENGEPILEEGSSVYLIQTEKPTDAILDNFEDYAILRAIVIDMAKKQNIPNPEKHPDALIDSYKKRFEAQREYLTNIGYPNMDKIKCSDFIDE